MEQDKHSNQQPKVDKEALKASKDTKKKALANNEIVRKDNDEKKSADIKNKLH